mmetsp:Transcript_2931/g.8008  ORF Transcript_2931/g.8008 Transcript_2931/m.8008 type:complete len:245 (-) Transcript_2931:11-745(-)
MAFCGKGPLASGSRPWYSIVARSPLKSSDRLSFRKRTSPLNSSTISSKSSRSSRSDTTTSVISGMRALSQTAALPRTVDRLCQKAPSSASVTSGPQTSTRSMDPVMPICAALSWQPNMVVPYSLSTNSSRHSCTLSSSRCIVSGTMTSVRQSSYVLESREEDEKETEAADARVVAGGATTTNAWQPHSIGRLNAIATIAYFSSTSIARASVLLLLFLLVLLLLRTPAIVCIIVLFLFAFWENND